MMRLLWKKLVWPSIRSVVVDNLQFVSCTYYLKGFRNVSKRKGEVRKPCGCFWDKKGCMQWRAGGGHAVQAGTCVFRRAHLDKAFG